MNANEREKNGEKKKLNIILDNAQMNKTHLYMNVFCVIELMLVNCYIIDYCALLVSITVHC